MSDVDTARTTAGAPGGAGGRPDERADLLRSAGLRVTQPRLAVLGALREHPHSGADVILAAVRRDLPVSVQAVYDVLNTLAERDVVRRFQPAGSVARYELRTGDNHHHLVCRSCRSVTDVDCAPGAAPCLEPRDLHTAAPGFVLDEAEVTFWGLCAECSERSGGSEGSESSPPA